VTVLTLGPIGAERISADEEAERKFLHSVEKYMTLRRTLDQQLPPLEVSDDARKIHAAVEARADAIRRARAGARIGDIFSADAGELFRGRIRERFAGRSQDITELFHEMNEDGEPWKPAALNGRFSWRTAAATPPYVLAVLPTLPAELQFRFVGPDLVLVDIVANVIVDVLPDVLDLPPPSGRDWR
jgi:hypothetical protein